MISTRKLFTLLTVLALALGAFGVSAQDDVPEGPVRLGAVGPFTGPAASIGQEILQWTRLAVDDFNEETGWSVEIVEVDTEIDPAVAVTAVEAILSDETVYGATGPAGSQVVGAVAQAFEDAGLAHISSASTNPDLTNPEINEFDTFFRVVPTDALQGPTNANYLSFDLGVTNLVVIDDQTSYAVGLADTASEVFEANGGTVLLRESITQDDTDFSALITRIAGTEAEAVFFPGQLASQGALFAQQLLEQGVDVVFFGADGFNNQQEFIDDAAGATEGAFVSVFAPDIRGIEDDTVQATIDRYVEEYDDAFSAFGPPAYVAADVVLRAMLADYEADGELSRAGTLEAVAATDMESSILGTPISFDENGDVAGASFFIFEVVDGAFVLRGTSSTGDDMDDMEGEEEDADMDSTEEAEGEDE
ncbi:MAG: branched-chain amino acid ABC transporter substrate-binding protein [Chloroflexota bacterium]